MEHPSSIWGLSFLYRGDHSAMSRAGATAGRVSWVLSRWGSRRPGRPSSSRSDRGRWKPVGTFLYTGAFHDSVLFPNPNFLTITESENLTSINYGIYWTGDNLPKIFKLIKTILQWMGFQQHEQLKNYLMVEFDVIISKTRRGQLYHISGTDISTLVYYNTMFPFRTSERQIYI